MSVRDVWDEIYYQDERQAIGGKPLKRFETSIFLKRRWLMGEEILKELNAQRGMKILDCGCGSAGMILVPASIKKMDAYGIDISRKALDILNQRLSANLILNNISDLPYRDNFFDLVTCNFTIFHVDANRVIPEIARVLKPGGRAFIDYWRNKYHPDNLQYEVAKKLRRLIIKKIEVPAKYYSYKEMVNLFKDNDLEITRLDHYHGFLPFADNLTYPDFIKRMFHIRRGIKSIARMWAIFALKQ